MKEKIFKRGIARRLFNSVLALAMVVALMPMECMIVHAASYESTSIYRQTDGRWIKSGNNTLYAGDTLTSCTNRVSSFGAKSGEIYLDGTLTSNGDALNGVISSIVEDKLYVCSNHTEEVGTLCSNCEPHTHTAACYGTKTAEGHSTTCGEGTAVVNEAHSNWSDGKCGTCGYECEHNSATSGVCAICGKDLGSGSTTCEHAWSEWQYAPSHGDEWRYCSKCHKEERRAVASSSSSTSSKPAEPAKTDIEVREALEESMPVSPVSVDTTQFNKTDAAIIPGGTYNLSNFITIKGIVKGINTAVAASNKSGSNAVTIYSGRPFAFNGEILKAIQAGKKDVTYFFNHDGHLYSVTIPATVDATKVLEKTGFAGPLYVGQQLGTTVLIK